MVVQLLEESSPEITQDEICGICKNLIKKEDFHKIFIVTHGCFDNGQFIKLGSPVYIHPICFK